MSELIYSYNGITYPDYLKRGNAMQFIAPVALHFCRGIGLDIGCGKWPLYGARPIDVVNGDDAMNLPLAQVDFIFSSHCLEHLDNYVAALEHWKTRLRVGGVLFLYLPHPDMSYWRPENCRKHRHLFWPRDVMNLLYSLGFVDVLHSERDMAWSFAAVGFNGRVDE